MLRIIQNSKADGAKNYYSTSDYYSEGQELIGQWHGKGTERLGLSGTVERESRGLSESIIATHELPIDSWCELCHSETTLTMCVTPIRRNEFCECHYEEGAM